MSHHLELLGRSVIRGRETVTHEATLSDSGRRLSGGLTDEEIADRAREIGESGDMAEEQAREYMEHIRARFQMLDAAVDTRRAIERGDFDFDGYPDSTQGQPTTTDHNDRYRHGHEDDRHERSRESTAELGRSRDRDESTETTAGPTRSQVTSPGPIGPGTENVGGGGGGNGGRDTSPSTSPGNPGTRSGSSGTGSREAAERGNGGGGGGDGPGGGNSGGGYGGNDADGGYGDYGGLPIVMDLDGDSVELLSRTQSEAFYDINADGYQYHMGWAGADDGLLTYDKNGDGDIAARDEIAFIDYVDGARTDWEGLVHFDSNNDDVLDNRDAEFGKFRVWQDANSDGDVDAGELKTLAQHGIRSLDLNPNYGTELSPTNRNGNLVYGQGGYTNTDGTRGAFGDVALATGAMGYRVVNGALEFKSADGVGKMHVAPAGAGAVNMNFAAAAHAAHIGAIGGGGDDVLNGAGVARDLLLFGDAGDDRLTGGSGDDWLAGGAGGDGDDYLNGLVGDDALYGGDGSDTYDFGYPNVPRGKLPDFGMETMRDSGGDNDKITFGRRRHEDLWLAKDGDDLRINILGGDDEVLIEDHFAAGGEHRIETLQATTQIRGYGRYNTQSVSIDALVNAMAEFDKPQTGWASMSAQQRADIHAAWHTVGIAPTVG